MINKKNLLGKRPHELGDKDAIHVAIVAVRAGSLIVPGQRCGMNEHREAVPDDKGPGVADPFLKGNVTRGQPFWLLLDQDSVPNVRHEWEHPSVDFSPPAREVKLNRTLEECAESLGVTYEQLMAAASRLVDDDEQTKYPGTLSEVGLQDALESLDTYDLWSEWADETGHKFENHGSECCPEYAYPERELFVA